MRRVRRHRVAVFHIDKRLIVQAGMSTDRPPTESRGDVLDTLSQETVSASLRRIVDETLSVVSETLMILMWLLCSKLVIIVVFYLVDLREFRANLE